VVTAEVVLLLDLINADLHAGRVRADRGRNIKLLTIQFSEVNASSR
jgi:hypothetical protein